MRGSTPALAAERILAIGFLPFFSPQALRADEQRRGAVVHAGGVAGGDHAAFEQRFQLLQRIPCCESRRGCSSASIFAGGASFLFAGSVDGMNLALVEALGLGLGVFLLRGERELVGLLARDAEVLRHVVAGLGHRVVAELLHHFRVGEARADGGVEHLHFAAERRVGLAHDVRRAAHALDAAGDVEVAFAAGDGARRVDHRLQAARAQAVDGDARRGRRQAGEQRGEARDVAAVLARLRDAAHDHVADLRGVDLVARHHFLQHFGGEVVGTHRRELAGVAADRGAQSVVEVGIEHGSAYSGVSKDTPSAARRRSQGLGR